MIRTLRAAGALALLAWSVAALSAPAGKHLSPRLYVGYGLGLFDQVGAFKVRLDLTERWVLEATSGLGQAVDLLYTRER